jgi:hypothetical protein
LVCIFLLYHLFLGNKGGPCGPKKLGGYLSHCTTLNWAHHQHSYGVFGIYRSGFKDLQLVFAEWSVCDDAGMLVSTAAVCQWINV